MGLFDKKYCDVCGNKIGLLENRKLADGNLCKDCASKLSPFFSERKQSTVEEIKEQLSYREENKEAVAAFHTTRTFGTDTKIYLDEGNRKFMVTRARNIAEANPDVLDFSQITGCYVDIDESRSELMGQNPEGESVPYSPAQYEYDYNFNMVIQVNAPYFNEIKFRLNDSDVNVRPTFQAASGGMGMNRMAGVRPGMAGAARPARPGAPAGQRPAGPAQPKITSIRVVSSSPADPNSNTEYIRFQKMGEEIKEALTNLQQEVRDAAAPQKAVKCPWCGATSVPTPEGCCEYCGGALKG